MSDTTTPKRKPSRVDQKFASYCWQKARLDKRQAKLFLHLWCNFSRDFIATGERLTYRELGSFQAFERTVKPHKLSVRNWSKGGEQGERRIVQTTGRRIYINFRPSPKLKKLVKQKFHESQP